MGRNGSGPMGVEVGPNLASSSARSFPSIYLSVLVPNVNK